ncbi:MAG: hypothetical protein IJO61_05965 [Oscillospiraceae bacterium]|nr:hypothetical protein [Oscillospiraceae bacterium]
MTQKFGCRNWRDYIPVPVYEENTGYLDLYNKAWELAFLHIKNVPGMPQNPYMDEAFCDTQVWIWDSCFMSLFTKYARDAFPGVETLNNFYEVLYGGKHLPKIIPTEKEPEFTGAIPGEPYEIKVHIADNPPLFAWAEYENALISGDVEYIKELLYEKKFLQKHYEWIENLRESVTPEGVMHPTCLIAEKGGYRWEGGRSGMDNTPRGRIGEHAFEPRPNNPDMLWLDAICQQALSANMISKLFKILDDETEVSKWESRFYEKKEIINRLYFDAEDNFYYDIDINTHNFYKVITPASFWTLTSSVASKEQAKALASHLSNPETLGGIVPFVSLSRSDADFNENGEYWRGSVWLPTAYASLRGLANYGLFDDARKASKKLLEHMYKTYTDFSPHTIWECYSPIKPEPALNEYRANEYVRRDFCGWSALGPISVYIEFVLGFHRIDAFTKTIEWAKPKSFKGKIGIKNLRFGDIITDIEAKEDKCKVKSNAKYVLKINGEDYTILPGDNEFNLI